MHINPAITLDESLLVNKRAIKGKRNTITHPYLRIKPCEKTFWGAYDGVAANNQSGLIQLCIFRNPNSGCMFVKAPRPLCNTLLLSVVAA